MQILILAAGTGSRLWPLTRNTPKSLVDLGQGMTLLEAQLEAIRSSDIRDVVLVTGYRSAQIEAKIQFYSEFNFKIVYNPFYDVSNNLVSAWMGMPHVGEEFILVNGDDVYRPEVIGRLIEAPDDIVMVVSQKPAYDEEDMKVQIVGDRIRKVSKDLLCDEANGESIGMIKFLGNGTRWIKSELENLVREKKNLDMYYLHALQRLMDAGISVNYVTCAPHEWAEIDFHPDLVSVRERLLDKMDVMHLSHITMAENVEKIASVVRKV